MNKWVCPYCGNDESKGEFSMNVVIRAFRRGYFGTKGNFKVTDGGSPDYEACDIQRPSKNNPDYHRPAFYCSACGKDFKKPKKVKE